MNQNFFVMAQLFERKKKKPSQQPSLQCEWKKYYYQKFNDGDIKRSEDLNVRKTSK